MNKKIPLPIENCFKAYDQSFNRVQYFSVITDNLTTAVFPDKWVIKNKSGLDFAMKEVNDDKKEYMLDGYKHFIQSYLLRDCIESFAICLDKLFLFLLLNGKEIKLDQIIFESLSEDEKKLLKNFEKIGLYSKEGKLQILKSKFNLTLSEDYNIIISSLKGIRNCFAHGNGFVRKIDGKEDGEKRKFHWATFSIFGIGTTSGKKVEIEIGKRLEEEINICGKIDTKDHYKSFEVGEQLSFSSTETYEMAWSLKLVASEYIKQISQNNM